MRYSAACRHVVAGERWRLRERGGLETAETKKCLQ